MREFFKTKRFKIFLAVLAALLVLIVCSATIGSSNGGFVSVVISPVQKLSSWVTNKTTNFLSNIANSGKNADENKKLREQVASLREQLIDYDDTKNENEQLKEMMGLKKANKDYEYAPASVIGRDADDRYGAFQIDKGSLDGVKLHDPVITRDGLVGYISKISPTSARVSTILGTDINVGAYGVYSGETGVVTGNTALAEKGQCKLKYLRRESSMAKSELVVTTGLSGIFPKGLVIGTVEKIIPEPQGTSVYAVVEPAAQITDVQSVFVITSFTGQGEDADKNDDSVSSGDTSSGGVSSK